MSGECAAAGGRVRRPQRRPTCGVTSRSHPVSGVSPAYLRCFRRTQWAVSKVGECLGVVSRLVGLDSHQRWPQETVAMRTRSGRALALQRRGREGGEGEQRRCGCCRDGVAVRTASARQKGGGEAEGRGRGRREGTRQKGGGEAAGERVQRATRPPAAARMAPTRGGSCRASRPTTPR